MASEFKVYRLNSRGMDKAERIGVIFDVCLAEIDALIPPGRERSLVVTKLQEAAHFAKRAIAMNPEHQIAPEGAKK